MRVSLGNAGLRPFLAFVATLGLVTAGCGLDKVEDAPLVGPSETGLSVQLTALPDTLNADGVSASVIQLVLREQNGLPVSGRAVLFEHDGDGVLGPSVTSTYVGPIQTGIVMATDRDGVANVVYVAGTDFRTITVFVRPYGIDAANGFLRTVEIFQQ
jgi:hypothetical protein